MSDYKMINYYEASVLANQSSLNGLHAIYPELYYYVLDMIEEGLEVTGEEIKEVYENDQI